MNYRQKTQWLRVASYALSCISTILLFLTFMLDFDATNGYFEGGALSIAFIAVFALGFVPPIAGLFVNKKDAIVKELPNPDGNKNALAIFGTLLILAGVCEILFDKTAHETISMLVGIGICGFGIYFLILAIKSHADLTLPKLFALLLGACMPVGMILGNNANYHRHINSVENALSAIFAVCALLYILYEGNFAFKSVFGGVYFPAALVALHSGTTISLAYICAYICGIVSEETRFYQMLLVLLLCVAIRVRLGDVAKSTDEKTAEEWIEIENPPLPEETVEEIEETEEIEEQKETDE